MILYQGTKLNQIRVDGYIQIWSVGIFGQTRGKVSSLEIKKTFSVQKLRHAPNGHFFLADSTRNKFLCVERVTTYLKFVEKSIKNMTRFRQISWDYRLDFINKIHKLHPPCGIFLKYSLFKKINNSHNQHEKKIPNMVSFSPSIGGFMSLRCYLINLLNISKVLTKKKPLSIPTSEEGNRN